MPAKKLPAKKAPAKKAAAKKAAKKVVKKAAPKKTNIEKLTAAGVIRTGHADKLNHKVINKLSDTEVKTLIKLRAKLGALPTNNNEDGDNNVQSPNFPV